MTTRTLALVPDPEGISSTSGSGPSICGARAYDCRCGLATAHTPFSVHECGVPGCFASWTGEPARDTFRPVTLPTWPPIPMRLRAVS